MNSTTKRCPTCQTWITLTAQQEKIFHQTARLTLPCPKCGIEQKLELAPSNKPSPKTESVSTSSASAAPWGNSAAVLKAPTPNSTTPSSSPVSPPPITAKQESRAPFNPLDRYQDQASGSKQNQIVTGEKKSLSDKFETLPKIVQYAALFIPLIIIGVIVMSFFGESNKPLEKKLTSATKPVETKSTDQKTADTKPSETKNPESPVTKP
jgi:endogenous inhibitor of DNA gyrase (YacG/DUF329 family)